MPSKSRFSGVDSASEPVWGILTLKIQRGLKFFSAVCLSAGDKDGTREGKDGIEERCYEGKLVLV